MGTTIGTELVTTDGTGAALAVPVELVEAARGYAARAKSARTRDAYRKAWGTFRAWCAGRGLAALPASPATVALFLAARAEEGRKVATLALELAAISQAHRTAGLPSPRSAAAVQAVMAGIRRTVGTAQVRKAPVLVGDLRAMVGALPAGLLGLRDRALLLLGFATASRRSELVALDVGDFRFTAEGLEVTIRRSKTDQEAAGTEKGVPYGSDPGTCPVRAVRAWLEATAIADGPVFRPVDRHGNVAAARLSDRAVALVVKRTGAAAGLDASHLAGHSLRRGLATAAAKAGKSERAIMRQTGHRSVGMVRRYIDDADRWTDNAAAGIGL